MRALLSFCLACFLVSTSWAVDYFPMARDLAKVLKPKMGASGNAEADLKEASDHLVQLLEKLENSARGAGPKPSSLLSKGFSFVNGVGKQHRMMATASLMKSWDDARGMGLFDERGKFGRRITLGRDLGKNIGFEYLVSTEQLSVFGRHYGSVRLVIPGRAPADGFDSDSMVAQWANVEREMESLKKSMLNAPSTEQLERERHQLLWEVQLAQIDENSRDQLAAVNVSTRLVGGASHLTGNRRRFQVSLKNRSMVPTEVEVTVWVIGEGMAKRPRERIQYLMVKRSMSIRLLGIEQTSLEFYGPGNRSLNGHVTVVQHAKGRAGHYVSSARMEAHLNGEHGGLRAFKPWPRRR